MAIRTVYDTYDELDRMVNELGDEANLTPNQILRKDVKKDVKKGIENTASVIQGALMPLGNPAMKVASATAGLALASIHKQTEIGNFNGNIRAYGYGIPYILVTKKKTAQPDENKGVGKTQGFPSNNYVSIKNCKGFTKVKSIKLNIAGATKEEMEIIESILKEGFYV